MLIMSYMCVSDQDSVRLLAVEGCAALGKLLEPQDCVAHILPVIVNFSQVHFQLVYLLAALRLHVAILFAAHIHTLLASCFQGFILTITYKQFHMSLYSLLCSLYYMLYL